MLCTNERLQPTSRESPFYYGSKRNDIKHGGVITTGPDATPPPAICQNLGGGGGSLGGGVGWRVRGGGGGFGWRVGWRVGGG